LREGENRQRKVWNACVKLWAEVFQWIGTNYRENWSGKRFWGCKQRTREFLGL